MIDERSFYSPTLRLKEGEIVACANVTRDAKPYIAPVFVAAPPKDRDPEKRRPLTDTELIRENGLRVARAWGNLPCMLDVRFLAKRLAIENAESWIPSIFEEAARSGAKPGVVVNLAEAHGRMLRGYAAAMQRAGAFVAIRVTLADLQMPELAHLIHQEAALLRCRAWGARVCCGLFILVEAELEERVGG